MDINIEDNRNDEYVARAPKLVAFSGEGHKLGRYGLLFLFSVLNSQPNFRKIQNVLQFFCPAIL